RAFNHTPVEQLTEEACLPALATLNLSNCSLDTFAVQTLAASRLLGRIQRLNLSVNQFGGEALRSLAASPHLKQLRVLDLGHNPLRLSHIPTLAPSGNLAVLIALHLRGNQFGRGGTLEMGFLDQLPALTTLTLPYNDIGPDAAASLGATLPSGLRSLDLSWNPLGDDGVWALARSGALAS